MQTFETLNQPFHAKKKRVKQASVFSSERSRLHGDKTDLKR